MAHYTPTEVVMQWDISNLLVWILGALLPTGAGMAYKAFGSRIKNSVNSAIDRRTAYNKTAADAENLLLSVAQMNAEQQREMAKRLDEQHKLMIELAMKMGEAKGKAETLEKIQTKLSPLPLTESSSDDIELLPPSQRRKHLIIEHSDEFTDKPFAEKREIEDSDNAETDSTLRKQPQKRKP